MNSCLYHGVLRHRRLQPTTHQFTYQVFMAWLDLDELAQLPGVGVKRNRFAATTFHDADYPLGTPLKENVLNQLASLTGERHEGRVMLLTQLRYFGFHFNPVNFYYCYDRAQIRKAITAVVDGVGILQQLKMGALIVFERKTKLGDIIETGTQINCEPSGQIVGNIFFNKAPLHDGAMIIRDGMIHAAGCILPLTKNTSVSAELGTRHRAALGVSEESDAVVVVVSEETGQISVAVNGVLARRFTRDTLRDVLEGYLIPQEEASTVRRKFDVLKSKRTVKK